MSSAVLSSILYIKYKLSGKTWLYDNGATKKAEIYTSVAHGDVTPNALKDIMRSVNETSGMEFSYTMWLFCKDWTTYKKGQWKHILHKGDPESWPGRAPGIWFHPDYNILASYICISNLQKKHKNKKLPKEQMKQFFAISGYTECYPTDFSQTIINELGLTKYKRSKLLTTI